MACRVRPRQRYSRTLAIIGLAAACGITLAAGPPPSATERISLASDGSQGNGPSGGDSYRDVAISADGRFVVFGSSASNLVAGDTNGVRDIFVRDRVAGTTTRVSVTTDGTEADDFSQTPVISADGRYVAFASYASNLVTGSFNSNADIFVHDCFTGVTTRESISSGGAQGNSYSLHPALSADGRYLAFTSWASNLVTGDTNGRKDTFLRDRLTGVTTRVSVATDGTQGNLDSWDGPAISANGQFVALRSDATNLVPGDTNGRSDIFVHDCQTGVTSRVSVATDGTQANDYSALPALSGDGRLVVFGSTATNLDSGDTNEEADVFVHDTATGLTTRVSVATDGTQGNLGSGEPILTPDGRLVAFSSSASNLVADDTNESGDVFLHDLVTGTTTRESVASGGEQGDGGSTHAALTPDARYLVFDSGSTNLVPGDTNQCWDVYVRDRGTPVAPPSGLAAGSAGSDVSLAWMAPAGGLAPTGYIVEAGSGPGLSDLAAIATCQTSTSFNATGVPERTYYLRVRATRAEWVSSPSNEVTIRVGGGGSGGPGSPGAPEGLVAASNGSSVAMSWTAPSTGGAPNSYVIEAGSGPGAANLARIPTGNPTPSFVAIGVPNGLYFLHVRATNAFGTSPPSNEVSVVVNLTAPGAPSGLTWSSAGSSLSMTWNPPTTGGEVSAYRIEAGSAPGQANLALLSTGGTSTIYSTGPVANGTYYVRVKASNGAGLSLPSNEVALVVGCTGPPEPPRAPQAWTLSDGSGEAHVAWVPPARVRNSSNGHTAYILEIGSAPGRSNLAVLQLGPEQAFMHFRAVHDGTYYVRVKARNACGLSAPSNELWIIMVSH